MNDDRRRLGDIQSAIAGMRDRTIHRYPEVDLEVVWDTLVVDLANLADRITEFLARTT